MRRLGKEEEGQDLIEVGLIMVLVSIAFIGALQLISNSVIASLTSSVAALF